MRSRGAQRRLGDPSRVPARRETRRMQRRSTTCGCIRRMLDPTRGRGVAEEALLRLRTLAPAWREVVGSVWRKGRYCRRDVDAARAARTGSYRAPWHCWRRCNRCKEYRRASENRSGCWRPQDLCISSPLAYVIGTVSELAAGPSRPGLPSDDLETVLAAIEGEACRHGTERFEKA